MDNMAMDHPNTPTMQTLLSQGPENLLEPQAQGMASPTMATCYQLQIPAGMTLNEAQQAIFEEQARELGLSNSSAQKLLEISHRNANAHKQAHEEQVARWAEDVRHDKDLGGSAMDTTLSYAKAGLARFDPQRQLFKILQETGYANHPCIIRFLAAIGKAHAEDAVLLGQASPSPAPRHQRLYGKYNK